MLLKIILKVTKNQSLALCLSLALSPSLSPEGTIVWKSHRGSQIDPFLSLLKVKKGSLPKIPVKIWLSICFMTMKFYKISKRTSNPQFSFKHLILQNLCFDWSYMSQTFTKYSKLNHKPKKRMLSFCAYFNLWCNFANFFSLKIELKILSKRP